MTDDVAVADTAAAATQTPKPGDTYVQSFARGLAVIRSFSANAPHQTLSARWCSKPFSVAMVVVGT